MESLNVTWWQNAILEVFPHAAAKRFFWIQHKSNCKHQCDICFKSFEPVEQMLKGIHAQTLGTFFSLTLTNGSFKQIISWKIIIWNAEKAGSSVLPGVAGQAGAEQCVSNGNGDKMLMQPAVHPAVWYNVVSIAYSTTWTRQEVKKQNNVYWFDRLI